MNNTLFKNAARAGLIAGIAFLILEMIMVPLFGGGAAWGPPRMMGAIVLGQEVLPPPATFDFGVVIVAVLLHLVLSVAYALILAFIIRGMTMGTALAVGAGFGLAL